MGDDCFDEGVSGTGRPLKGLSLLGMTWWCLDCIVRL
jgi:hypothetical protein